MNQYELAKKGTSAVYKILEVAHQTAKANREAKPLRNAISFYERGKSINLIHQYVNKYRNIINATSPITGRFVINQEGFYDDKSDGHIKTDLQFLVLVIYLKFAGEYGLNVIAEKNNENHFR